MRFLMFVFGRLERRTHKKGDDVLFASPVTDVFCLEVGSGCVTSFPPLLFIPLLGRVFLILFSLLDPLRGEPALFSFSFF
jgi:hypothetical protein